MPILPSSVAAMNVTPASCSTSSRLSTYGSMLSPLWTSAMASARVLISTAPGSQSCAPEPAGPSCLTSAAPPATPLANSVYG